MPFGIELLFADVSEVWHIHGHFSLHSLTIATFDCSEPDHLNTPDPLPFLSLGVLAMLPLDHIGCLVGRRRLAGVLGLSGRLNQLRCAPAIAEFVLKAFPVFVIL
jgi:hypothetical protein